MKIKYILYIYILAMASACAKFTQTEHEGVLLLSPIVSSATKLYAGPVEGMYYPKEETLGVYAFYSEQPSGSWTDSNKEISTFIDRSEFKYKEQFDAWGGWNGSSYEPYFWPSKGSLIFAGYSPYRYMNGTPISNVSFDVANKELLIKGFKTETYVPMSKEDIEDPDIEYQNQTQSDLAYFLPEYDVNGNYSGISYRDRYFPVMSHALSLVVFKVYAAEEQDIDYVDLNSIVLNDVYHEGDFRVRMDGTKRGQAHWDLTDGTPSDMNVFDAGKDAKGNPDGLTLDTDPRTVAELLIIPGITHDISVHYRLHVNGKIVMDKWNISPTDIDIDPDPNSVDYLDEWEIGKKYVYNICLGVDFISVSPDVSVWSENTLN